MDVFRALLHDAAGSTSTGTAGLADRHRALRARPDGWAVGPLVVDDERLSGLDPGLGLSVVTGGGAGSLPALARRAAGLHLVAVETVLRDPADLAGNAARVVAAAAELGDDVTVFVGLPPGHGLVDAVEVVEAAGLQGRLDLGAHAAAAGALSVLVEADLPFKVTGLATDAFAPHGLVAVLMAVEALVDGADPEDAEQLLAGPDETRSRAALGSWDAALQARVVRRLRGADTTDVAATLDRLGAGLLAPGS